MPNYGHTKTKSIIIDKLSTNYHSQCLWWLTPKSHFLLTALLGTSFRASEHPGGKNAALRGDPAVEDVEYIQNFRLVCAGKQLSSGSLADYAVGECDTLKMLLSVNGGMRAKWRKKRMRRLRRKRRKMRQRAR
ncbi:hypothetical protein PRNP1_014968 [Phytophthora ramorum]